MKMLLVILLAIGITGCGEEHTKDKDGDDCVIKEISEHKTIEECRYGSGQVKSKVEIFHGRPLGTKKIYYTTGELFSEVPGNGKGFVYEYYKNGTVSKKIPHRYNKFFGRSTKYSETGEILEKTYSHDDNKDNIKRTYYSSGAVESETPYKDGKKDGIEKSYFKDNGGVQFKTPYKDGKVHGTIYRYNVHGDIMSTTDYNDGQQLGDSQWNR